MPKKFDRTIPRRHWPRLAWAFALGACGDAGPAQTTSDALIERPASLAGVHDPPLDEAGISATLSLLGSRGGWTVNTVYATDYDWVAIDAHRFDRARERGLAPVVRIDYARPDATVFADGSPALGATVPPDGRVGWCLARRDAGPGGSVRPGPSREGGTHLECYLRYVDDLVARTRNVHTWLIGNEMNMGLEARAFPGGCIAPRWYAEVYRAARARIRAVPGHARDAVFVGGVAPGPADHAVALRDGDGCPPSSAPPRPGLPRVARYLGAREYLQRMLYALAPAEVDGLAMHAYGGWPRATDNGGVPALTEFEEGRGDVRDPTFGYRAQARWIDALGWSRVPLLLTEMSVHTHLDRSDARDTAGFIRDAYAGIQRWNETPGAHALLGAVWFTYRSEGEFAEESIALLDVGADEGSNPVKSLRAVAARLGPGDAARAGTCVTPPGVVRDSTTLDGVTRVHLAQPFRAFWTANGGLSVFGHPLEESACREDPFTRRVLYSQTTERQRFEYHPEHASSRYDAVQIGRLGAELAARRGVDLSWRARAPGAQRAGCAWIGPSDAQGHWVCGRILEQWRANGLDRGVAGSVAFEESLMLYGYPLTEELEVTGPGTRRSEQWFERARLERHALARPYDVLGGRLGAESMGR